ncbi:MAG: glycosyltransferase family 4 protein, partial [Acidimicrobiales bacterium]|nr:glycosyltransferase family 4 protein [Acidimicrobiales bacterium]
MSLDWLLGPQLVAFAEAGFEVIGMSAPGPHAERLRSMGIAHVGLRYATRAIAFHRDAAALAELYHHFRRLRSSIVHTHNPKPGVYGRIAARLARVPVVVNTQHGLYATPGDPLRRRALVYSIERVAAACSDAELVQNVEDRDTLARLGVPDDKLTVLGNGIDLSRFDPRRFSATERAGARAELLSAIARPHPPDQSGDDLVSEPVIVGLIGRLVVEKGYREVFAAAGYLRRVAPEVRLVIIGPEDPDKHDAISQPECAAAKALGNVGFLGLRHDVERLYTGMDLYLLASHREGFPRSAMEASAMGLPVVATDIRGCRQVVDHGHTGLLVPVHDPVAIAEAVTY